MIVFPILSPIIKFISGLEIMVMPHNITPISILKIVALVTEYDVLLFLLRALFLAVILDMVSGMLEPTMVSMTMKMDRVILYIPSSVVVIIFVK